MPLAPPSPTRPLDLSPQPRRPSRTDGLATISQHLFTTRQHRLRQPLISRFGTNLSPFRLSPRETKEVRKMLNGIRPNSPTTLPGAGANLLGGGLPPQPGTPAHLPGPGADLLGQAGPGQNGLDGLSQALQALLAQGGAQSPEAAGPEAAQQGAEGGGGGEKGGGFDPSQITDLISQLAQSFGGGGQSGGSPSGGASSGDAGSGGQPGNSGGASPVSASQGSKPSKPSASKPGSTKKPSKPAGSKPAKAKTPSARPTR